MCAHGVGIGKIGPPKRGQVRQTLRIKTVDISKKQSGPHGSERLLARHRALGFARRKDDGPARNSTRLTKDPVLLPH